MSDRDDPQRDGMQPDAAARDADGQAQQPEAAAGDPGRDEAMVDAAADEPGIETIEAEVVEGDSPWGATAGADMAAGIDDEEPPRRRSRLPAIALGLAVLLIGGAGALWLAWPQLIARTTAQLAGPAPETREAMAAMGRQLEALQAEQAALRTRVDLVESAGRDAAVQLSALNDQLEELLARGGAGVPGETVGALDKRLADVEQALAGLRAELEARLAEAAATPELAAEVGALRAGLTEMQDALAALRAAIDERLNAGAGGGPTADALAIEVAELNARVGALRDSLGSPASQAELNAAKAALASTNARLEALEQAGSGAESRLGGVDERLAALEARVARPGPDARREALVLAVAQLHEAVLDGAPYAAPLETAGAVAGEDAELAALLAPLQAHAGSGIPTRQTLDARFPAMVRAVLRADAGRPEGFVDRTWARLGGLVTVRRVGEVAGDSAEAVLARSEQRLISGDLSGAVDELAQLGGAAAAAAAPWRDDAMARLEAERALEALRRAAISGLAAG